MNGYFGIIERSLGNYARSLEFLFKFYELSKQSGNTEAQSLSHYHIGTTYKYLGDYEKALHYLLEGLSIGQTIHSSLSESISLKLIGQIYFENDDYTNALHYNFQSLKLLQKTGDKWSEAGYLDNIGNIYFKQRDYIQGLRFCQQSLDLARSVQDRKGEANSLFHLAQIFDAQDNHEVALNNAKESLEIRQAVGDKKGQAEIYLFLGEIFIKDSIEADTQQLHYLQNALALANETGAQDMLSKIHFRFYKVYRQKYQFEKALEHLETSDNIEKEIHSKSFKQKILNLEITHKIEQSKKEAEIYRLRNVELADLYEESKRQKEEIQITLTELEQTQAQLIQSEKMASLGELTAGIAHEIQNPLNFVNNFSEVNKEMLGELNEEIDKGNYDDAKTIAIVVIANEEKINHHGKRADAIVKGMLQHSRQTSSTKELTDINALCDEYLRLSYHVLRAKDKSFNTEFKTEFDESIGRINVVPQDIGRVLLNLYNNAFYAVNERKKTADENYKPFVSVQTKKLNGKIEIVVKDNGNGIPQNIVDKIFQPFFTTKPTGQGTGL